MTPLVMKRVVSTCCKKKNSVVTTLFLNLSSRVTKPMPKHRNNGARNLQLKLRNIDFVPDQPLKRFHICQESLQQEKNEFSFCLLLL
jgi:hypothetical protein